MTPYKDLRANNEDVVKVVDNDNDNQEENDKDEEHKS